VAQLPPLQPAQPPPEDVDTEPRSLSLPAPRRAANVESSLRALAPWQLGHAGCSFIRLIDVNFSNLVLQSGQKYS